MEEQSKKENMELWNSKEMREAYGRDNYRVTDLKTGTNRCYVFFSSNGLYYPNTVSEFEKVILQENRYDWEHIAESRELQNCADKMIFVRDVYKQWYINGINQCCENVDALIELLSDLTYGYDIVTVGCSSGGYAAVLAGIKLGAKKIYSFSGQFTIENEVDDYYWLTRYRKSPKRAKYYKLFPLLEENRSIPIYYFYPAKCGQDVEQYNTVKSMDHVYEYAFNCSAHADTVKGRDFPEVLTKTDQELRQLHQRYKGRLIDKEAFLLS